MNRRTAFEATGEHLWGLPEEDDGRVMSPMEPDQIAEHYDRLAQHWASEAFNRQNGIAAHERALRFLKERSGDALDVGCGCSGRFLDWMRQSGLRPEGLDISPRMLALARERHPEITFIEANVCRWEPTKAYTFISAWDSIWHVPLDRQEAVLRKLLGALRPGGVLVFTAGGLDKADEVTNPCHGVPLYHATLGLPALLRVVDRGGAVCRHLEFDQPPESHVFMIVRKRG